MEKYFCFLKSDKISSREYWKKSIWITCTSWVLCYSSASTRVREYGNGSTGVQVQVRVLQRVLQLYISVVDYFFMSMTMSKKKNVHEYSAFKCPKHHRPKNNAANHFICRFGCCVGIHLKGRYNIVINPNYAQCYKAHQMQKVVASCLPSAENKRTIVLAGGSCCIEQPAPFSVVALSNLHWATPFSVVALSNLHTFLLLHWATCTLLCCCIEQPAHFSAHFSVVALSNLHTFLLLHWATGTLFCCCIEQPAHFSVVALSNLHTSLLLHWACL